ncbi:hypothetical protein M2271_002488 [Streptomyces sp. LBL]|uniref:hypothetical protein n=1 Tax=Streptomyces sp. LBL TaxID=2940562 RepID=UPI0024732273|nr:hypothetical protein [Streptomyces sp. LBL]MDH6624684.1 hypothetical protein [Streptomyces sp. LBL]
MDGEPADHVTLQAHRPGHRDHGAQRPYGLVAAVGQAAVEADREAQARDGAERRGEQNIEGLDQAPPQRPDGRTECQEAGGRRSTP